MVDDVILLSNNRLLMMNIDDLNEYNYYLISKMKILIYMKEAMKYLIITFIVNTMICLSFLFIISFIFFLYISFILFILIGLFIKKFFKCKKLIELCSDKIGKVENAKFIRRNQYQFTLYHDRNNFYPYDISLLENTIRMVHYFGNDIIIQDEHRALQGNGVARVRDHDDDIIINGITRIFLIIKRKNVFSVACS